MATVDRRRRSRHTQPSGGVLDQAAAAQAALLGAARDRDSAFVAAAYAGWTFREISEAVALSAATVCRIVNRAEGSNR